MLYLSNLTHVSDYSFCCTTSYQLNLRPYYDKVKVFLLKDYPITYVD